MHRYAGLLKYVNNNSGREGQYVKVDLAVSFFPGRSTVLMQDANANTRHSLSNRRFNCQARDSPRDLLAREKWRSFWRDRFAGPVYLQCPRISDVPMELQVQVICSWGPAFAVIEFRLADTLYQLPCRPPCGVSAWSRILFMDDENREDARNEPPSDSRQPPEEPATDSHHPPVVETPS